MSVHNLETKNSNEIVEENTLKKFDLDKPLSERGLYGLRDLLSSLPKINTWDKYATFNINTAARKRIDEIVSNKRISMGNLSIEEEERMKKLVEKVKKGLNGDTTQMIEQFAEIRDWIMGTLSTSDGKSEKDKNNFLTSQKELENKDIDNKDWWESLQKLREFIQKKIENQQEKTNDKAREACRMWDKTTWIWNPIFASKVSECLRGIP